jgi:hypothetical protein
MFVGFVLWLPATAYLHFGLGVSDRDLAITAVPGAIMFWVALINPWPVD